MGDRSRSDWPSNSKESRAAEYQQRKEKHAAAGARWYANNRSTIRANDRKKRYGIEQEEYDRMYREQDGKCAICKSPQTDMQKALSVDHHHKCDGIRGLLCHKCNRALGLFTDNPELLRIAIRYLEVHKCEF